jgi:multidrug efflux pump subunit AcrB
MNISAPFIERPIATALLMVALLAGGIVTYPLLPVASLPSVNYPTLTVTAQLPGADPQTMASTVASPLELQFGEIPGLTQMTSASALGYTQITLQFELSRKIDGAVSDTLSAIQTASAYLPKNMPYPPMIRKVNPADTPILVLAATSDTLPITVVDAYAQNILLQKLSQISGVGLVGIGGQQQPTVRVRVDPEALAARGIDLDDVRTVLGEANVDLPKGQLNSPRQTFTFNTNDQLFKPDQYDNLIIAYRNGAPVRIRDIGRAISAGENELISAWYNKQPAILLSIQRQPGANVIETVQRIKAMLPVLQASIPPAVKISVVSDRTQTIRASVDDVQFTLLLTVALVVMVICIFLRNFWATVIPAVTVPLSLIGTFAVLYELGYSLDNLSLMARRWIRGRRRRRRDREHRTAHRERPLAVRGGDEGIWRDWLYSRGHHALAHRRVHSAVPDERLCRIAVPRIRDRGKRRSPYLLGDLSDPHADDVRLPAQAGAQGARMALSAVGTRLRCAAQRL